MAPPVVADGRRAQQPQQGLGQMLGGVLRMAMFWYFASQFFGKKKPVDPALLTDNLFRKGEPLDMWFYISEKPVFTNFGNEAALVWHEVNVPYAVWTPDSVRTHQHKYYPSEAVKKNNGSVYGHVFFARSGFSPDPSDPEFDPLATFGRSISLVTYLPKPKVDRRKSLLAKDLHGEEPLLGTDETKVLSEEFEVEDNEIAPWISFLKPNVTINLVEDFTRYPKGGAPSTIAQYLHVDETSGNYYPVVFVNEFWLLRDKLFQINDTVHEVVLHLDVAPISLTRWQLYLQIDQSFQLHRSYGSMLEGEADELKRVFLEGNPYLLVITMIVSAFHSIFDFLAFKNDVQFWNKNKSMEGLSARSVVINFVCQFIIFLYLLNNETSWMIIISSGVGCCIEFWKIGKAMHIEIDRSRGFPMIKFRHRDSYSKNKTKEYDDLAMRYLSYALYPLVGCFAIYSLIYDRHKSWYSWILSSLTSCVYTFGFIMMCPQLFINYKLKSVAHLPWRQMTYKFLNTIIDDLFAFVIKMPTLHRLSVFRDDIIFLIYLYQRWAYPVDKKRVNEFGFGGSEEGTDVKQPAIEAEKDDTKEQLLSSVVPDDGAKRTAAGLRVSGESSSGHEKEEEAKDDKKTI